MSGDATAAEAPSSNLWILGVALVLLGSLGQNLGNNLVSLAHTMEHGSGNDDDEEAGANSPRKKSSESLGDVQMTVVGSKGNNDLAEGDEDKEEEDSLKKDLTPAPDALVAADEAAVVKKSSYFFEHLWGIGTTTFVVSSVMTFVAFGFAAQSLLASLESVQFVSNIAFAKLVHKEEITYTMIVSTLLIVGGNALVVIFSGHNSLVLNGAEVFALYAENSAFHIYLAIAGTMCASAEYTWKYYHKSRLVHKVKLWNHSFVEPLCFCVSSAIIGAFAVVNAKNMSMLLASSASSEDRSEFKHEQLYIIFFCWIFIVGFWVGRIDQGLDLFPPLFVIPVIQVCFVFFSILCGGIFFKEFHTFTDKQFAGFSAGVSLILFGVYGLAPDTELDFSANPEEDVHVKTEVAGEETIAPKRANKRLSFSASSVQKTTRGSVEDPVSGRGRTISGGSKKSMKRINTMSHPLAALKELGRVGVEKAEAEPAFAPMVRGARRLSILAASPFFATPEDDADVKTDTSSSSRKYKAANTLDSV